MIRTTCPDLHDLQVLMEENAAGEADDLVRHLETCTDCQQTLEKLAAEADVWEDIAHGLVDVARKETALHTGIEQMASEEPLLVENDLSFLRPSDKTGWMCRSRFTN